MQCKGGGGAYAGPPEFFHIAPNAKPMGFQFLLLTHYEINIFYISFFARDFPSL